MSDYRKLSIQGFVTVKNGNKVIVDQQPNAIVRAGMRHLVGCMSYSLINCHGSTAAAYIYGTTHTPNMRFGKDITATTQLTDALVSEIKLDPTFITNNNGVINSGTGKVLTKFNANWRSGLLNAQLSDGEVLGEIGLFLGCFPYLSSGSTMYTINNGGRTTVPVVMFSRFVLGDNAFVPSETAPVIVEWEFRWNFV